MSMTKAVKDFWLENARLRAGLPPWSNAQAGGMLTKALLVASLLGAGGAGLFAGRTIYMEKESTVVEKQHGSLLQHLEDGGYHLPPQ